MSKVNMGLVRSFYTAIQNGDYNALRGMCHQDFKFYLRVDNPIFGVDGFIASEKKNFDAFEGFTLIVDKLLADDEHVAAYLTFEGIQTGMWDGNEPRGAKLKFSLMMLLTICEERIIEKRAHFDRADILRQLTVSS